MASAASATWSGALLGVGLAGLIAGMAWRAGSLSRSGAAAAVVVGGVAITAGAPWGVFLVGWFVSASVASRVGRVAKARATADVVAKGGQRDAWQVFANGGVYAACALGTLLDSALAPTLALMGAASLAAAGADTLATETGTLWRGQPLSLRTFSRTTTGASGAVSLPGTLGMVVGAFLLAWGAAGTGLIAVSALWPVALAAIAGAVADTLIGAWWQARRWCPLCERETEQRQHRCGTPTRHWRGQPWLDNDGVNFLCTLVGAATAFLLGHA